MQKYKLFDQVSEPNLLDENICDEDEVTISNQKKGQEFDQPIQHAGPEKKLFEFDKADTRPPGTRKPDDGQPKPEIFYQILNSKNKDFGKILGTSGSQSESEFIEEIGGKGQAPQLLAVEAAAQLTDKLVKQAKAANMIAFYLTRRLRQAVRTWRGDTEAYINEINFRIRNQRMFLQKQKVVAMIKIKVANEKALLRMVFASFCRWKMDV